MTRKKRCIGKEIWMCSYGDCCNPYTHEMVAKVEGSAFYSTYHLCEHHARKEVWPGWSILYIAPTENHYMKHREVTR